MNRTKKKILMIIVLLLVGAGYYYVKLPALNIHSSGFWGFVIVLGVIVTLGFLLTGLHIQPNNITGADIREQVKVNMKGNKKILAEIFGVLTILLVVIYIGGSILSSQFINAEKYKNLISINNGDFVKDIDQISFDEIPLLDKDSAEIIGTRKMGTMVEYVSQFEVCSDYTQINYKSKPVRVTPLRYGNLLKWFSNMSEGIPAYIKIDMATQDAECVKLKEGMKYTEADHFNRNIHRYLRFHYPTYIFDTLNFEIDDDGNPVYICPVKDFTIGLFGGEKISDVVIVNAVTGELNEYPVDKVPNWVDRVYSADMLVSYYNYYGSLQHGYWNSILSQKDCLKTTDGYNYLALDDDVWVYTGVTSVGDDQSNVGFVLMNQRTTETKYYSIAGAEEYSAMSSAEGKVQHLNYTATFPLLLNISNTPTYFICLKDSAGLVKQFAMVSIEKYTIVSTGTTIAECQEDYMKQLAQAGATATSENADKDSSSSTLPQISGKITKITQAVVDGNSHFYLLLDNSSAIFDVNVADNLMIVKYSEGDTITLDYTEGKTSNNVSQIIEKETASGGAIS